MIQMRFCQFEYTDDGCVTRFPTGQPVEACPHDTHHYHVIAHRCGYGDDILAYCREHEFCHNYVEEALHEQPSRILFALALGSRLSGRQAAYEELTAQSFQRWLRANERPIVSGVDWDRLKSQAEAYLRLA